MKILSKAEQLAASDLPVIEVPIPEWGDDAGVLVRMLTAGERDELETKLAELKDAGQDEHRKNFRARVCTAYISDDHRNALYSEEDIDELANKAGAALDGIFDAGCKLNRMFLPDPERAPKNLPALRLIEPTDLRRCPASR